MNKQTTGITSKTTINDCQNKSTVWFRFFFKWQNSYFGKSLCFALISQRSVKLSTNNRNVSFCENKTILEPIYLYSHLLTICSFNVSADSTLIAHCIQLQYLYNVCLTRYLQSLTWVHFDIKRCCVVTSTLVIVALMLALLLKSLTKCV